MEKIKEQFSKVTREIRERKELTQEQMANELYLAGKQTVYSYESGRRFMKIPEFVEFVKKFDEAVLINKDGISLLDTNFNIKTDNNKENKNIKTELSKLNMIEEKGDVSFYEHVDSKKMYQKVEGIGLIQVVDGDMEYQTVKTFGDIVIKYNTNGCHGYSIWINDRCYEDNFWVLEQAEYSVKEMFLLAQKNKTISVMTINLENKLEDEAISLEEFDLSDAKSFVDSIDDVFLDGGEFRCECFMDIAIPYALNFGELESNSFYNAIWECAEEVFVKFKEESMKTVVCRKVDYNSKELDFSYDINNDGTYAVTIKKDNKELKFKEFCCNSEKSSLDMVMESIKDDYILYKECPDLKSYIEYRGVLDDVELEYSILKLDIASMIEFFGEFYLENLILL